MNTEWTRHFSEIIPRIDHEGVICAVRLFSSHLPELAGDNVIPPLVIVASFMRLSSDDVRCALLATTSRQEDAIVKNMEAAGCEIGKWYHMKYIPPDLQAYGFAGRE